MIARDRDSDANGSLEERLYALQDANFNVTSVADTSGNVVERYLFDPYGQRLVLDASFSADADGQSDVQFQHGHQGGKYDSVLTNQMLFRHRVYDVEAMRWMQQDPLGYVDGMSLFSRHASAPVDHVDPRGTEKWVDIVPKPNKSSPGKVGDPDLKPEGKEDKKTNDWPVWWSRIYSTNVCMLSYTLDTSSVEDMVEQMKETVGDPSKPSNRISRWVIRAHGSGSSVVVGDGTEGTKKLTPTNVQLLKPLQGHFSEDAELILWACNCGQNKEWLQQIANLLQIKVSGYTKTTDDALDPWGDGEWVMVTPDKPAEPVTPEKPVVPAPPTTQPAGL
jgi:RHS repeat-associated protein